MKTQINKISFLVFLCSIVMPIALFSMTEKRPTLAKKKPESLKSTEGLLKEKERLLTERLKEMLGLSKTKNEIHVELFDIIAHLSDKKPVSEKNASTDAPSGALAVPFLKFAAFQGVRCTFPM